MKNEIFLYEKPSKNIDALNIWLAFPGPYNFGMSALGFLTVFETMDRSENINIERIFTDTNLTKIDYRKVDMIGFSFSFEMDFLAIFKILEKYNIPFNAKDRDDSYPLIYAGGPVVTANPEPFCQIFDYIELGDAENKTLNVIDTIFKNKDKSKKEILEILSKINGIYVPSLTIFNENLGMQTLNGEKYFVTKSTDNLKNTCVSSPILTDNSFFKNTFIIELSRGCPQKCFFCNTAHINFPYRICNTDLIMEKIDNALKYTHKLAFLGASIATHPDFEKLCKYVADKKEIYDDIELSVSSLRADGISENVAKYLVKCNQKHATIALEVGSEKLRNLINKNISNEQFKNTVKTLRKCGFKGVKIYGLIGLPTETQEDIQALVNFAKELKQENKGFEITFGFSTFIPKALTPFQYMEKENSKSLEKKYEFLKKEMHKIGVKINVSSVTWDYFQALFSRGGRELFDYAIDVYKNGGNIGAFKTTMKNYLKTNKNIDFDKIVYSAKNTETKLPWDFINTKLDEDYLIKKCKAFRSNK